MFKIKAVLFCFALLCFVFVSDQPMFHYSGSVPAKFVFDERSGACHIFWQISKQATTAFSFKPCFHNVYLIYWLLWKLDDEQFNSPVMLKLLLDICEFYETHMLVFDLAALKGPCITWSLLLNGLTAFLILSRFLPLEPSWWQICTCGRMNYIHLMCNIHSYRFSSSPKNENPAITYSLSYCSKYVWVSFFCWT